jgi:predicted nucleic-acid-binding protein
MSYLPKIGNPLHLAVIYRNADQIEKYISWFDVRIKRREYLTNIAILENMVKFKSDKCDKLFELDDLGYAFKNGSFVSVEVIIKTCKYAKEKLHEYTKKYINNDNFVDFCLSHGCKNLLYSIFENSEKNKNYIKEKVIIRYIMQSCYFQENKTLRFVIDTLDDKYDFNLAAKFEKANAIEIFTDKRAFFHALATDNATLLHSASKFGNLGIWK